MDRDVRGFVWLILGLIMGIPASYYLQSGMLRAKVSLGAYLTHLPELLKQSGGEVFPPILLSCAVLGTVGWFLGRRGGSSAQ